MQSADCMRHRSMLIRYALPLVAVATLALAEAAAGSQAQSAASAQAVAEAELRQHYDSAMRAAVSTLHRYLAKLPEDHAAADACWSGGAPAADATEADPRALASPPRQF